MLKRPITFKDLSGEPTTRDFYFNLTIPEVTELEYGMKGGLTEHWVRIVQEKDAGAMLREFKRLIAAAYGERGDDGITFYKIDPITGRALGEKFLQTDAYAVLFLDLLGADSSDEAFSEFLRGCVPAELVEKMPKNVKLPETGEVLDLDALRPVREEPQEVTRQDLMEMSQEEFDEQFGTDPAKWDPAVLQAAYRRRAQLSQN